MITEVTFPKFYKKSKLEIVNAIVMIIAYAFLILSITKNLDWEYCNQHMLCLIGLRTCGTGYPYRII